MYLCSLTHKLCICSEINMPWLCYFYVLFRFCLFSSAFFLLYSCFANVVLQCLTYTQPLVTYLLDKGHQRDCKLRNWNYLWLFCSFLRGSRIISISYNFFFLPSGRRNDWCFLCVFQAHVERASQSSLPFSPINILSRLPNIGGNLGYGRQEDAHEFMRLVLLTLDPVCLFVKMMLPFVSYPQIKI